MVLIFLQKSPILFYPLPILTLSSSFFFEIDFFWVSVSVSGFISKAIIQENEDPGMYHQSSQHFDLEQDNANLGFGGGEPTSWLSGEDLRPSSPSHRRNLSAFSNSTATTAAGNVDRLLFNDLVEIVPLVQSLIVCRPLSLTYTHYISMYMNTSIFRPLLKFGSNKARCLS